MLKVTVILLLIILGGGLPAGGVHASASPGYQLDWLLPLSGVGGSAASANYAVDLTLGQTAIGPAANAEHRAQFGYWAGLGWMWWVRLPLVTR